MLPSSCVDLYINAIVHFVAYRHYSQEVLIEREDGAAFDIAFRAFVLWLAIG